MPELPEVETVINYLKKHLIGRAITKIKFKFENIVKNVSISEFIKKLVNQKFLSINRKGKYLIFNLTNNVTLVIHLRMEGKLFVQPKNSSPNFPQLIAEFYLDDENLLRYYDTRKFGTFEICSSDKLDSIKGLSKLAMDAIDDSFTPDYLFSIIQNSNQAIKTFLLDQSNVAGLGNIYVNEVLFESFVLPTRPSKKVTYDECCEIVKYSKQILLDSIKHKGSTIHSYKFSEYDSGGYQKYLKVHTRSGKPCPKCNNLISFSKVNGRGTYFCSKCQK